MEGVGRGREEVEVGEKRVQEGAWKGVLWCQTVPDAEDPAGGKLGKVRAGAAVAAGVTHAGKESVGRMGVGVGGRGGVTCTHRHGSTGSWRQTRFLP